VGGFAPTRKNVSSARSKMASQQLLLLNHGNRNVRVSYADVPIHIPITIQCSLWSKRIFIRLILFVISLWPVTLQKYIYL